MTKVCSKCKVEKPHDDFSVHILAKDGRQSWCKECTCAVSRKRYAEKKKELKRNGVK